VHHFLRIGCSLLLPFCLLSPVFAQSADIPRKTPAAQVVTRALGSQIFQVDLGLGIPLMSANPYTGTITPGANLDVGGSGSIKWSAFLDSSFALGVDVAGLFTTGPNGKAFSMFPIGIRASNFFRIEGAPLQIPIHLTAALNIMRYKDLSYVGFAIKPGFGIYWDATKDWSFGLNTTWIWAPEIYTDTSGAVPINHTRHAHFLEVTLSALYSF